MKRYIVKSGSIVERLFTTTYSRLISATAGAALAGVDRRCQFNAGQVTQGGLAEVDGDDQTDGYGQNQQPATNV